MKLPDTNLLLYAYDQESPHHANARHWLEAILSASEPVGFAWTAVLAFIRLSTRPQTFRLALAPAVALDVTESWLAQPNSVVLEPTERHLLILRNLLEQVGTAGNLTMDAHLAALAIEHGGEVCSADHDFGRFPGLRWSNPLLDPGKP